MGDKDVLGQVGEAVAARVLGDAGLEVIDRNWRCARGEIDIVASDGSTLIFCEVKTRSSRMFGDPLEAVHPIKAMRLRLLACMWLADHPGGRWGDIRFDVISVLKAPGVAARVRHVRGAI
ncbi:MAG: putative endonuclease [Mycobacterium sp.]|nr:putative endonuclease [Mycobacterium sp.]